VSVLSTMACPELRRPLVDRELVLHWSEPHNPLPVRYIHSPGPMRSRASVSGSRPKTADGPLPPAFDFSGHIRRLCADLVKRTAILHHIDVSRLLFAVTQARSPRAHGLQARVTPLRCPDGRLTRQRRGVTYQVQRYFVEGHEFLYVIHFCLPRFLDQEFREKFITLFEELYHISPAFDGDLRRHQGRYAIHAQGRRGYDPYMEDLARAYFATRPDPRLYAFLRLNFAQLCARHGGVAGIVVPRPKVIPLEKNHGLHGSHG
jgi:predicted metallopeptidase